MVTRPLWAGRTTLWEVGTLPFWAFVANVYVGCFSFRFVLLESFQKDNALASSESLQRGWSLPISPGLVPQIAVALSAILVIASPGLQSHLYSSKNCGLVIFSSFCNAILAAAAFAYPPLSRTAPSTTCP